MKLQELKSKIQELISKATEENNNQKQILSFLFDKLAEVKELETIDRLRKFKGGDKYLQAYLLYKSISRANYQPELTEHMKFDEESGQDKLLEAISLDIEQFIEKEPQELPEQPNNSQLVELVNERIKAGEIVIENKERNCEKDEGEA